MLVAVAEAALIKVTDPIKAKADLAELVAAAKVVAQQKTDKTEKLIPEAVAALVVHKVTQVHMLAVMAAAESLL